MRRCGPPNNAKGYTCSRYIAYSLRTPVYTSIIQCKYTHSEVFPLILACRFVYYSCVITFQNMQNKLKQLITIEIKLVSFIVFGKVHVEHIVTVPIRDLFFENFNFSRNAQYARRSMQTLLVLLKVRSGRNTIIHSGHGETTRIFLN